ncbi:MAG: DUF1501 domain-containing protein [Acidobacteria bacterium]|nr:DUF1501 domain-containing protein [Acidobacteriota bacterium]
MMTRRDLLKTVGMGFGGCGLASAAAATHFPVKAKQIIFVFLNGGPSQVDTFDPKPMLQKYHGKPMPAGPNLKTERKTGNLLGSPFQFNRCGKSGIEVSEIFPRIGQNIDEFAVIRSMYTDRPNHEPSLLIMNCGVPLPGKPSMGSWLSYGLGSMNKNLPSFVVLCPGVPVIGSQLWTSAFLPAVHQGVHLETKEKDVRKLVPYITPRRAPEEQRRQMDLLASLNKLQAESKFESGVESMEVAFRMQKEAPEVFDITRETEKVRERYGDTPVGRGCLMARRMVEKGVRMVQIYHGNGQPWDNHDDIQIHRTLAREADPAIASLIEDLRERDMLKETIVLVGGEFGRTPSVEVSGLVSHQNGRDHNNHGYSMLVAGGGFKGGITYGATDDFGFKAVENRVYAHDLQATMLQQMGIDHTRLTYRYGGRDFRLTDVGGSVIQDLLA